MKLVRAVLGDLPAGQLGVCDAHTHVVIEASLSADLFPEFHLSCVERAVEELVRFKEDGGGAMIDAMPGGCGRNIQKLVEISRRSGVHLVASTGMHLEKYYRPEYWGRAASVLDLAALWSEEIVRGIEVEGGGEVRPRAGVIKIASGMNQLSALERRTFEAAAQVHQTTGAPILTHTEQGTAALEQTEFLRERGVNLKKVVLSHTDRKPEVAYHRELLKSGVGLEYDSGFRWKEGNPTADLILELAPEFPEQILLGTDAARPTYWKCYGGSPGMSFLVKEFKALLLERGLSESLWNQMMIQNPASYYSFEA